jgi:glycosyltransferase involved in cell wall biosynthesis
MEYRPGVREIVRDGLDGLVVPSGDVPGLAVAMARLMDDPAERRRLGARAPEVVERYGMERVLGLWAALLDEVAVTARASRPPGPEAEAPLTP